MASNFSAWQETEQAARVELIRVFLQTLQKSKAQFKHTTDLAKFVASHLREKQGTPCSCSTLLRNPNYKVLLLTFMTPTPSAGQLARRPVSPTHQFALLKAELNAYNLSKKLERAEARQAKQITSEDQAAHTSVDRTGYGGFDDFVLTCQALFAVLKHFDGLLLADANAKRIIDRTTRPESVVVDDAKARPFFEWLYRNRNVGEKQ